MTIFWKIFWISWHIFFQINFRFHLSDFLGKVKKQMSKQKPSTICLSYIMMKYIPLENIILLEKISTIWQLVFSPMPLKYQASYQAVTNNVISGAFGLMFVVHISSSTLFVALAKWSSLSLILLVHLCKALKLLILGFLVWKCVISPTLHLKVRLIPKPPVKDVNLLLSERPHLCTEPLHHLLKWSEFILLPPLWKDLYCRSVCYWKHNFPHHYAFFLARS